MGLQKTYPPHTKPKSYSLYSKGPLTPPHTAETLCTRMLTAVVLCHMGPDVGSIWFPVAEVADGPPVAVPLLCTKRGQRWFNRSSPRRRGVPPMAPSQTTASQGRVFCHILRTGQSTVLVNVLVSSPDPDVSGVCTQTERQGPYLTKKDQPTSGTDPVLFIRLGPGNFRPRLRIPASSEQATSVTWCWCQPLTSKKSCQASKAPQKPREPRGRQPLSSMSAAAPDPTPKWIYEAEVKYKACLYADKLRPSQQQLSLFYLQPDCPTKRHVEVTFHWWNSASRWQVVFIRMEPSMSQNSTTKATLPA